MYYLCKTILQINYTVNQINTILKDLDLIYFDRLKNAIQEEYLKEYTPLNSEISQWKGLDIVYFQEDLRKKAKGNISEKTFYTYFKKEVKKVPRIDMLNLLSIYAGYTSWNDFKKQNPIEQDILTNKEIIPEQKNILILKKQWAWGIVGVVLLGIISLFTLFFSQKTFQYCFSDSDTGRKIKGNIDIKLIKENESPIHYKVKAGECFQITTKDNKLKMEISAPLYEKIEIIRDLEDAPEIENIALKPDDYALMLHYYSTKDINDNSLELIKNKQQQLNKLISDDALIYQVFDSDIYGIETLTKQKYIGLVTTPTKSLQNLKVLSTKIENGKIISIKFKIEQDEEN